MLRQGQGRGTAPFSWQLSSHLHFPNALLVSKLRPEPSLQAFPTGRGWLDEPTLYHGGFFGTRKLRVPMAKLAPEHGDGLVVQTP